MCFSVLLHLPTAFPTSAVFVEKQTLHSEGQNALPPPSTFQRKCNTQGARVLYDDVHVRYCKDPVWKSEICPNQIEKDEIEKSVRMIEDMLDVAHDVLERSID